MNARINRQTKPKTRNYLHPIITEETTNLQMNNDSVIYRFINSISFVF